ncbi:hypothetical protein HMI55_000161 [Coelomomyces lativittatus]|nr:hypothetical protein HMI55_000161 [Coelomomyces lativittatus]
MNSSHLDRYTIGVCAMGAKSKSKPMTKILNYLSAMGPYIIEIFSEDVILNKAIEDWPVCQFLISFFSGGFPLDKAIQYVELRKPILVNDLKYQKLLFDRRVVLAILEQLNVLTLPRLIANRCSTTLDPDVQTILKGFITVNDTLFQTSKQIEQIDYDTLVIDGKTMVKPFVEKPVDGENHHVYVYFHTNQGGGCRKLFRKIANKSSEYFPDIWEIRKNGSYIYEDFIDTTCSEDVKVYTLGSYHSHAETRKSPVVDGIVQRNQQGKEIRYSTELTFYESMLAHRICCAFRQFICGFDLLRSDRSFVIDINGWSFVKNNNPYFEQCAKRLHAFFQSSMQPPLLTSYFSVVRHADRTPKLKHKFNVSLENVSEIEGNNLKYSLSDIQHSIEAALLNDSEKDPEQLKMLMGLLKQEDIKVQVKKLSDKAQLILKWGGVLTHAGREQTQILAKQLNTYFRQQNPYLLNDFHVISSSEPRVSQTAEFFLNVFKHNESQTYTERPDLVDQTFFPLDMMENVKLCLSEYLESSPEAKEVLQLFEIFFNNLEVPKKLCHESPEQFLTRWKYLANIPGLPPSKLCALYDQVKYDYIHHVSSMTETQASILHQLYKLLKSLFSIIAPGEYGTDYETKNAYSKAAIPLLRDILHSLVFCRTQFYFTKESHIHTFLNVLYKYLPDFLPNMPLFPHPVEELDYLTQITVELYAQAWNYFVRLKLSRGALILEQTPSEMQHHAIGASDSFYLTDLIPLDVFLYHFKDIL